MSSAPATGLGSLFDCQVSKDLDRHKSNSGLCNVGYVLQKSRQYFSDHRSNRPSRSHCLYLHCMGFRCSTLEASNVNNLRVRLRINETGYTFGIKCSYEDELEKLDDGRNSETDLGHRKARDYSLRGRTSRQFEQNYNRIQSTLY